MRMVVNSKELLVFILAFFLFVLLIQNTQVVTVRFLFLKVSMSQIVLIVLTTFLGLMLGYTLAKKS